jgi:predicted secreted acid phosphatase
MIRGIRRPKVPLNGVDQKRDILRGLQETYDLIMLNGGPWDDYEHAIVKKYKDTRRSLLKENGS